MAVEFPDHITKNGEWRWLERWISSPAVLKDTQPGMARRRAFRRGPVSRNQEPLREAADITAMPAT